MTEMKVVYLVCGPPGSGLQLEYLESTSFELFRSYTGYGRTSLKENSFYEGNWLQGRMHGEGRLLKKYCVLSGTWNSGTLRTGEITYKSGTVYSGDIINRKPHGHGTLRSPEGGAWEGKFRKGVAV